MDFSLTDQETNLLNKARKLSAKFAETARHFDETGEFPAANFDLLREEGLLKLTVPEEHGGYGLWAGNRYLGFYLVLETIAQGCSATGLMLQVHSHCASNVAALADDEQKRRILGDVVQNGALIGSAGNATMMVNTGKAALRPVEGGFRYSAYMQYGSVSETADYLLAFAGAPGTNSFADVVTLCIPSGREGVSVEDTWSEAMGMRATGTCAVRFDDVFVPWDDVLGRPGDFVRDPRGWTLGYVANYLGTAQSAFDAMIRDLADHPELLENDHIAYCIGDMESALQAARTSLWYAAWLWERADFAAAELAALRASHTTKQAAMLITNQVFEILGTRVTFRKFPFERAWRDARTFTLHTRETKSTRILADALIKGDFHSKQIFSKRPEQKSWESFGVTPPLNG